MHIDITRDDILQAYARSKSMLSVHAWHNPLAIALERHHREVGKSIKVAVTREKVHIYGDGIIGRFTLTDPARRFLFDEFLSGIAKPVERMQIFTFQNLSK